MKPLFVSDTDCKHLSSVEHGACSAGRTETSSAVDLA